MKRLYTNLLIDAIALTVWIAYFIHHLVMLYHRFLLRWRKVIFDITLEEPAPRLTIGKLDMAEVWLHFRYTPEVQEWCRENLKGRTGILPCEQWTEIVYDETAGHSRYRKVLWFDYETDMILFKLRWF